MHLMLAGYQSGSQAHGDSVRGMARKFQRTRFSGGPLIVVYHGHYKKLQHG